MPTQKLANALFAGAKPLIFPRTSTAVANLVAGGIWVGGNVTLSDTDLSFAPNAVNKALHQGEISYSTPLAKIELLGTRFAFFTKIVDVTTAEGTFSFRCYGADAFVQEIQKAVAAAKKR